LKTNGLKVNYYGRKILGKNGVYEVNGENSLKRICDYQREFDRKWKMDLEKEYYVKMKLNEARFLKER